MGQRGGTIVGAALEGQGRHGVGRRLPVKGEPTGMEVGGGGAAQDPTGGPRDGAHPDDSCPLEVAGGSAARIKAAVDLTRLLGAGRRGSHVVAEEEDGSC